jgi:hypothetical protein
MHITTNAPSMVMAAGLPPDMSGTSCCQAPRSATQPRKSCGRLQWSNIFSISAYSDFARPDLLRNSSASLNPTCLLFLARQSSWVSAAY